MRTTTFVRPLSCRINLLCLVALGLAPMPSLAQDAPPPLPSDPKALMLLAAKTNSLTGADVQPWHLKATFTALDEKGNSTDQGPYEEFWASPTKYKRTFTGTAFTRIDYGPIVSRMLPEPDPACGSTSKPA